MTTAKQMTSFCRICGGGCGTLLTIGEDNRITGVRGDDTNIMTRGYACFKGLQVTESLYAPNRLLHPQKKLVDGRRVAITSEQALAEIAKKIGLLIDNHGPESVAVFCGNGALLNTTAYGMHRNFLASLGSKQFFSTLTIDQSGKAVSYGRLGAWAAGLPDFDDMDVALLFGTNPLISHNALGFLSIDPVKRLKTAKKNGLKLITIDPRRTETARQAHLALQPYPGQDPAIAGAIIRLILEEGWEDREFCARFVGENQMTALRAAVAPLTPDYVEARAGLERGQIREVANLFANARCSASCASTGPNMAPFSNLSQHLIDCLNVICGRFLRAGDPVHRIQVMNPAGPLRAEVIGGDRGWESGPFSRIRGKGDLYGERLTGTLSDEILTPGVGQIRALIVDGGDPITSFPDRLRTIEAMRSLELLVTIEPWMSATASEADYILPPVMQYERADLCLDIPGYPLWPGAWAQYTPALVPPPAGSDVVEDWYVFWAIARNLGFQIMYDGHTPIDMQNRPRAEDLLELRLKGSDISLVDLIDWPSGRDFGVNGTRVEPASPDNQNRFDVMPDDVAAELLAFLDGFDRRPKDERSGGDFTHLLSVRRSRDLYNSIGTHISTVRKRNRFNPAFLHPDDLAAFHLEAGELVELVTAHGGTTAIVAADVNVRPGVISISHGWGGLPDTAEGPDSVGTNVNLLIDTDRHFEDINAMPHMSAVPVRIRRCTAVERPARRDTVIARFGMELYEALRTGHMLPPLTGRDNSLTIDDAYSISLAVLEKREADGERVIGKKIGVTSKVVQDMLGVHQPDFGFLTDRMLVDGEHIDIAANGLIQPRAEAEIAFILGRSLIGPGITAEDVLAATDSIAPCFEIVDSRIQDWKIAIVDTVADNASCGVFVLGSARADPRVHDLPALHVAVTKNGAPLSEGYGSAVRDSPLQAVAWLANTLGGFGVALNAGDIILSGSLVPLEPVARGDRFEMQLAGIGSCAAHFY